MCSDLMRHLEGTYGHSYTGENRQIKYCDDLDIKGLSVKGNALKASYS